MELLQRGGSSFHFEWLETPLAELHRGGQIEQVGNHAHAKTVDEERTQCAIGGGNRLLPNLRLLDE